MKSLVFTLCLSCAAFLAAAQNTFPNPGPGNAGIGTTNPSTYTGYFGMSLDNTTSGGFIDFRKSGSVQAIIVGDSNGLNLYTPGSQNINFSPGVGQKMTILSTGAVGIGYPTPLGSFEVASPASNTVASGIFHLNGSQSWGHVVALVTNAGGGDDARLLFSYRAKSKQWAIGGYTNTSSITARFSIWEDCGDGVFNSTQSGGNGGFGTERFTVLPGGNVGIGQSAPANKLDVNGTIHAKAVNVDLNGWQDKVFSKTYKLRSLAEVKAYIDKNRHLPEVPAGAAMVKKGLNVAEMNELLMKKVEELTLYLIKKDEEMLKQQIISKNLMSKVELQDIVIRKLELRLHKLEKQLNKNLKRSRFLPANKPKTSIKQLCYYR